jgi:hypothetical protein
MMIKIIRIVLAVLALSGLLVGVAMAKTSTFTGDVVHVSTTNIKVYNPDSKQTLGFVLTPHFDQVISRSGKATIEMKDLKPGTEVKVFYDQSFLGMRHVDKIVELHSGEAKS